MKDLSTVPMIDFALARKALDFLERHRLEPSALHYEIALLYHAKPDCDLARAVSALVDDGLRLTGNDAQRLGGQYLQKSVAPHPDNHEATIEKQANKLGLLTSDACELTNLLSHDVGDMIEGAGDGPIESGAFVARLSTAERELLDLRAEFAKLQTEITTRQVPDSIALDREGRDSMTDAMSQHGARAMISHLATNNQRYVLIVFGIDDLVALNERFGRSVGDNILNAFAATLRSAFPGHDLIRWTGNEFVVVMVNTPLGAARIAAQEAIVAMAMRRLKLRGSGNDIGMITASAGLNMGPGAADEDVLARARARLLVAAAAGGNRFEDRA